MTLRRIIIADVTLRGSVAKRTIAFPVSFSRKRTNVQELRGLLGVQLIQELGRDLYQDVTNVVAYLSTDNGCLKLASFNKG